MADRIGPNFAADLAAAGLSGLAFSVDNTTGALIDDTQLTPAQVARVQAAIAAHVPAAVSLVSDARRTIEALIAEGIIPATKAAAIRTRIGA